MKTRGRRRVLSILCLIALCFQLGLTNQSTTANAAKKAKLQTKKMTLTVGRKKTIKIKNKVKKATYAYKTNKKKVATVTKKGKVTAKKKGTAVITVKQKLKKKVKTVGKVKVTVKAKKKPKVTQAPPAPTRNPTQPTPENGGTQVVPDPTPVTKPKPTADPNFTPVTYKNASFETGTDGFNGRGGAAVSLQSVAGGQSGKCLKVSGRSESWNGASLNVTDTISRKAVYQISAWVKQDSGSDKEIKISCALNSSGKDSYPEVGTVVAKSGEWTKIESTYAVPRLFSSLSIYFETVEGTDDFYIDEVMMTQVSAGIPVVDPDTLPSLKDTYASYFDYMGVCIGYYGYGGQLQNEELMKQVTKQYNSITLENEMKPDAILGGSSMITKEEAKAAPYNYYIPDNYTESKVLVLSFSTIDKILEIAHEKGLKVRAHTLMWHQQTPEKFFKTNYSNSGSKVSPAVMDARLEFYVRTVMAHVLEKEIELTGSAGSIVYAWDVSNEYTHRANNPKSPSWVDVYGDMKLEPTYVKAAYTYAYDELKKKGVEDKVTLFCNDYNTYEVADNMISLINYINSDGKICKGVGMQSHLDIDYPTIDSIGKTIDKFKEAGLEIQITELDVTLNCPKGSYNPIYRRNDDDQAEYYSKLMKMLIEKKKAGANITGITFWGLSDSNSWRSKYSPLLFVSGMNTPKASFYKVIEAAKEAVENAG